VPPSRFDFIHVVRLRYSRVARSEQDAKGVWASTTQTTPVEDSGRASRTISKQSFWSRAQGIRLTRNMTLVGTRGKIAGTLCILSSGWSLLARC